MNLDLFTTFSIAIQLHILASVAALVLGPFALLRQRRDRWHKRLGYAWVTAMALTAGTSFGILSGGLIGPFGPIHLLSVFVCIGLYEALRHIRAGRVQAHRGWMIGLYLGGVITAGLFTFLPGRRMSLMLFPEAPWTGLAIAASGVAVGLCIWAGVALWSRFGRPGRFGRITP